jgi:small-conductance mechanosensitive channel
MRSSPKRVVARLLRSGRNLLICVAALCAAAAAQAQEGAASAPSAVVAAVGEAPVRHANRVVAVMRVTFFGISPADRARRAERAIDEALARGGPGAVEVRSEPQGHIVSIDAVPVLILTPGDVDGLGSASLGTASRRAAEALGRSIAETAEARDRRRMVQALAASGAATLALALALWVIRALRRRLGAKLALALKHKAETSAVSDVLALQTSRLLGFARWLTGTLAWLLALLLVYEWATFVLTRFPYTRVWGEELDRFFFGLVRHLGGSVLRALPDLAVALAIFLIARGVIGAFKPVFDRAQSGRARIGWLDPDLARPSRRLFSLVVWLFAIVMAYPYLPGADTDAFKGVSVLVGLMLTLGGSSLVGQAASGLLLMYSRTLRVGEYVRIGDNEGTVHELGTFTTKIRTGLGEEVTLPNSLILGTVTRNYSRTVTGTGYIVDTTVTIGYDTPWRQVEAMLIDAARRTAGVLENPAPRVFQTGLSDFYVEYRLVAQAVPSQPRPRAEVLNALHGNVQDVFNEFGVQIMSPHYLGDPATAKVVPRGQWHAAPARRPE